MGYLLKNAMILKEDGFVMQDVYLENGKVRKVAHKINISSVEQIDLKGCLLAPGLVDMHVHFREPGGEYKETIETGSQAAAAGGFTEVYAMPNLNPVPDTPEQMDSMRKRNQNALIKVEQIAPIGQNLDEEMLVDFENMGTRLFSNDGRGLQSAQKMYEAMQVISNMNGILIAHTEDESLSGSGCAHPSLKAIRQGIDTFNELSETTQIARDLVLADKTACHYHICHLSSEKSVELIRFAKEKGVKVSSEVTPHHLLLSKEDIDYRDANYKMNPPLREKTDQMALLKALDEGLIECIASDHAPHHKKEKEQGFEKAPFGIISLDFAFPLLYTQLVLTNKLSLETLLDRMSNGPRRILNQKEIFIQEDDDADLAVFDLNTERILKAEALHSKSQNTPFLGEKLKGYCTMTFVEGELVWQRKSY